MSRETYWAALPSEEFAGELEKRIDDYYRHVNMSGRKGLWEEVSKAWYSGALTGAKLQAGGDNDEFTLLRLNHLRNIGRHIINLITAERPAFDAKATNADYESETRCILAQGILDYDMREKRLEDVARNAVEFAVRSGEGWVLKVWDTSGGEPWGIDPESGLPINTGTLRYYALHGIDVARDPVQDPSIAPRWAAPRRWVNKWDLAAKYPESVEDILSAPTRLGANMKGHWVLGYSHGTDVFEQDEVEVFEFLHKPTEALPAGRRCLFVGGAVLDDGPMPYRRMPIFRMQAGMQDGSCFGYTMTFDLTPIQAAVDSLASTIASNQAAFGVQSILIPKGSSIDKTQVSKGLQVLSYDMALGKPEALQLTKTAPETFTFLASLVSAMETLSGVSSVVRGDPQASLKSGSALAMVASQALQYTVDLQASYIALLEDVTTGAIEDYQDFATLPQVALIAGKSNRSRAKEWVGEDLKGVTRVTIDVGNALSKTLAGRSDIASQLLQTGLIKDPREFIEVLVTGRLEPVTEGSYSEMLLVRSENERMSEGVQCGVLDTDDHVLHIKEHRVIVASPSAREEPEVVAAYVDHQAKHMEALRLTDPLLLSVLGIAVPPDNVGAPPPAIGPGAGPPPPGVAEGIQPGPMPSPNGPTPPMPQMPQPPKNPQTGQRASAPVAAPTPAGARPAPGPQ